MMHLPAATAPLWIDIALGIGVLTIPIVILVIILALSLQRFKRFQTAMWIIFTIALCAGLLASLIGGVGIATSQNQAENQLQHEAQRVYGIQLTQSGAHALLEKQPTVLGNGNVVSLKLEQGTNYQLLTYGHAMPFKVAQ